MLGPRDPAASAASDGYPSPGIPEPAARLRQLHDQGKSGSAASRQVARELGLNKSLVYQIWIGLDQEPKAGKPEP